MTAVLPPILLLIGLSAFGPLVMNGVLPASTAIMADLQASYGTVQLMLTVYLLAITVSQLVFGSWSDVYGRRPITLIGLVIFSVGGAICALAPNVEVLLLGRYVQGTGASVCFFMPRTIVRDVYTRDKAASVIGYMTTAMMIAPMFGPATGGWITDNWSWRTMYWLLTGLGVLFTALSWRYLNETSKREHSGKGIRHMLKEGYQLVKLREFQGLLLILSGTIGVYYSFLASAPYIMMELRGLNSVELGIWFGMVGLGYLTGNLLAGWLSVRLGAYRMITVGLVPFVAGNVLFWVLSQSMHPFSLFFPMQLIALSNGMMLPNLTSAAMSVNLKLSGSAAGISGTIQFAVGVTLSFILGYVLDETAYPFFIVGSICVVASLFGYYHIQKDAGRGQLNKQDLR